MIGIIVVFPSRENAANIRNLLVRYGMTVSGVCTTGAQAMNHADALDEGIVVCGYKLKDMMYTELREYLPENFEMLLVASGRALSAVEGSGVLAVAMPLSAYDLVGTLSMMQRERSRRRKKEKQKPKPRSKEERAVIENAKALLMERNHMTESEAHRYIQKCSMDSGTNLVETAQMILALMSC